MTALRGAGMRFNLGRAVCWVIMDARDGAGEIRRLWGELVVAHAFRPSDYDSASSCGESFSLSAIRARSGSEEAFIFRMT